MKKILVSLCIAVGMLAMAGMQPVYADQPEPPQPQVIPAEINVDPYSQTVFSPEYKAVWEVGIWGQGDFYSLRVCWGDSYNCFESGGYTTGTYSFHHNYVGPASSPFYQSWTLYTGIGTPAYDSSVVYK